MIKLTYSNGYLIIFSPVLTKAMPQQFPFILILVFSLNLIAKFYSTQANGYDWNRLNSSAADSVIKISQLEKIKKPFIDSLISYDRLYQWSKQSVIRILNDDIEKLHAMPLVAAWVSDDEVLLNYIIKSVKNGVFVRDFSTRQRGPDSFIQSVFNTCWFLILVRY